MNMAIQKNISDSVFFVDESELSFGKNKICEAEKSGKIFAVSLDGRLLYPTFVFIDNQLIEELADIIEIMTSSGRDPISIAAWFISVNGYLDGRMPADMLQQSPHRVIEAAQFEVMGILHG